MMKAMIILTLALFMLAAVTAVEDTDAVTVAPISEPYVAAMDTGPASCIKVITVCWQGECWRILIDCSDDSPDRI